MEPLEPRMMLSGDPVLGVLVELNQQPIANDPQPAIDLGQAIQGQTADAVTFKVTNTSGARLRLADLQLPNGVTLVEPLAKVLRPGRGDSFTVRLDTALTGSLTDSIIIAGNDPALGSFQLNLSGSVTNVAYVQDFTTGLPDDAATQGDVQVIDDDGNARLQLTETNATLYTQTLHVLDNVGDLSFDYDVLTAGAGDQLVLTVDGQTLWSIDASSVAGDGWLHVSGLDLSHFAGRDVVLALELVSADPLDAQVLVDNLTVRTADRLILHFDRRHPARYIDQDGDLVTLVLRGPGNGRVVLDEGVGRADALSISLQDTTMRSSLVIKTEFGTGTSVRMINVAGDLGSLRAASTDLAGALVVDGNLNRLIMRDVLPGDTTISLGADALAEQGSPVRIDLQRIDDLELISAWPIASLRADDWFDSNAATHADVLNAPWIGRLDVAGMFASDLVLTGGPGHRAALMRATLGQTRGGDWQLPDARNIRILGDMTDTTVTLTASDPDASARALHTLVVLGDMDGVDFYALSSVRMIQTRRLIDTRLQVASDPQTRDAAHDQITLLQSDAGLALLRVTGDDSESWIQSSLVAAANLGRLDIGFADTNGLAIVARDVRTLDYHDALGRVFTDSLRVISALDGIEPLSVRIVA